MKKDDLCRQQLYLALQADPTLKDAADLLVRLESGEPSADQLAPAQHQQQRKGERECNPPDSPAESGSSHSPLAGRLVEVGAEQFLEVGVVIESAELFQPLLHLPA